jgi:hypothetical protein
MHDHQALSRPVLKMLGPHRAAAVGRPVAWCHVDVHRPQAPRAVITVAAIGDRPYCDAATRAGEFLILGGPADGSASRLKK